MPTSEEVQARLAERARTGTTSSPAFDAVRKASVPAPISLGAPGPESTHTTSRSQSTFPAEESARLEANQAESRERGGAYQWATDSVTKWMSDEDFAKRVRSIGYGSGLGSHSDDAAKYIEQRGTYLYNQDIDKRGGIDAVPVPERNDIAKKAHEQALQELGALKTVGLWSSTIVLPEPEKPQSEMTEEEKAVANRVPTAGDWAEGVVWGPNSKAAFKPRIEYVGTDSKGVPVYRQESPASYGMGLLSTGITPVVATGVPDYLMQKTFGRREGAEEAKLLSPFSTEYGKRAEQMLRERRTYSDTAQDTDPDTLAGAVVANLIGITGDVVSIDPFTGALLPAAARGGKKLLQAARVTGDVEREASSLLRGIDDAERAAKALPSESGLQDAVRQAERGEGVASRTSRELAGELDNRTLAALGDEVRGSAKAKELARLLQRGLKAGGKVVEGFKTNPQNVADLLGNVAHSLADDAKKVAPYFPTSGNPLSPAMKAAEDAAHVQDLVDAVGRARSRAASSIRDDLQAAARPPVATVPKSTLGKAAAFVTGSGYEEALHAGGYGSYDALVEAIRGKPATTVREVGKMRGAAEKAVKEGRVVLDDAARTAMADAVERATRSRPPDSVIPAAGKVVTPEDLAALDRWASRAKPPEVRVPLVNKLTSPEWTTRVGLDPKNVAVKGVQWAVDRFALGASKVGGAGKALLFGADETKAWRDAGLTEDMRRAGIEAGRAVEAAVGDVAKLKKPEDVLAYLAGAPRAGGRLDLVTGGLDHWQAFGQAVDVGLVPRDARLGLVTAFVPDGVVLTTKQEEALLSTLDDVVGRTDVSSYVGYLRDTTQDVLGAGASLDEEGAVHAVGAIAAGYGASLPHWERWLGTGVVLTDAQHGAVVDFLAGGVGRVPAGAEKGVAARLAYETEPSRAGKTYMAQTGQRGEDVFLQTRSLDEARGASVGRAPPTAYEPVKVLTPAHVLGVSPGLGDSLRAVQGSTVYVPKMVREQVANAVAKALHAPGTTDVGRYALRLFARGVTRGTWITNPRHHLNNYYGDFEQIVVSHGWGVALRSQGEVLLQQLMAVPVAGQLAQMAGKGRLQRGVLALPEKAGEVLTAVRNGVARQDPLLDRLLWTAQTHVGVNAILDGGKETVRLGGRSYTYGELRAAAVRGGVFDSFDVAELARQINGTTPSTLDRLTNANPVAESVQQVAEGISERRRVGLFRILLEHGATPDEAAKGVVEALYDYRYSLTDGERGALRYFLPFWSWQKNANRQMIGALMTPQGAYRVRALYQLATDAGKIATTAQSDADGYGGVTSQMPPEVLDAYGRTAAYLRGLNLSEPEVATVLNRGDLGDSLAPAGFGIDPTGVTGGEWPDAAPDGTPRPTAEEVASFRAYMVDPSGSLSVPSYYADRPMVRMRAPGKPFDKSGKSDLSQFYAYLAPPAASEAAINWAGTWAGALLTGAMGMVGPNRTSERSPVVVAQEVFDVSRSPILGPVIASSTNVEQAGPPVRLKSETLGWFLENYLEMASPPGKHGGKYTLEGPLLQATYSMVPGVQDADRALGLAEAYMDVGQPEAARKILEATFGVASADISPRGVAGQEVRDTTPGLNKVPRDYSVQAPAEPLPEPVP